MGAGLYLIYPAFYTDVTDGYRLGRGARLRTDLGGLYFNALVSLGMFGLWALTRWDGLLLVIAAQILQMVRQLPPMVRYDGYHLLADLTGVPDLFHRMGPTLRSYLPRRWRPASSHELTWWARAVVTLWVVLVVPLLSFTVLLMVVALPRILGTTAHSVAAQAHLLSANAGGGHWAGAGVKALAIAALIVPVGGILLILARFVRRYVSRAWVGTRGKPAKRGIAIVAMVGVACAVGYAWWPHGGNYRPIQPGEHGTVQAGVEAAAFRQPGAARVTTLQAGQHRTATTVWPAHAALPTRNHPQLALVLVPRNTSAGSDLPTWVFPFNKPAPPGPGDNQALAVVTKDGGTAYDVAFALVYAHGDTVLNGNSAYAFASCRQCRAMAVSFDVVLVMGHAHVVAPRNVAATLTYRCISCVAQALAVQLVLTTPGPLSPAAQQQLDALWSAVTTFGQHLQGLSLAQIQAQLQTYERQIIAVVDPTAISSSTATADPSATATPSPSTSPDATSSPTGGTAPSASATTAGTTSATTSATTSETTSATTSPTTSPSPEPSPSTSPTGGPTTSPSPAPTPS